MQAYTDEMYYINDYLKGRKPVITTGFLFYAQSASQVIDRYTFSRLKAVPEVPEEVQMCCCELAESEYRREKQQKESGGEDIGEYWYLFSQLYQRTGIGTGCGQGTAQHCYEVAGRYRPVLPGGVICIPMRM